jgi:hypothetical protein
LGPTTMWSFVTLRKVLGAVFALAFLAFAARMLIVAVTVRPSVMGVLFSVAFIALAVGLLRDSPLARRCAAAVCLLAAFIVPFGIFNPYAVGDYYAVGKEPPDFYASLVWLIPLEAVLLLAALVLDPRKHESVRSGAQPGAAADRTRLRRAGR